MPLATGTGGLTFLAAQTAVPLIGPVDLDRAGGEALIVITRYEIARAVLADQRWRRQPASAHNPIGPASAMSVTNMNAPRHGVIRSLIGPMFSRRGISSLQNRAQQQAHWLCDRLLRAGPPADLVAQFCAPFTFSVQCDLLGIPQSARNGIREASRRRSEQPDATARESYDAETLLHGEVTAVLDWLQRHGGDGIYPHLIDLHHRGRLNAQELGGLAASLLFDGHILTSSQIANIVAVLLCHPARHAVAGVDGLSPAGREELLRWCPAITLGMARTAAAAMKLGDAVVNEGQRAVVAFGMVNRDPSAFDRPGVLDFSRQPNRHLTFGYGSHYCLGAHLARLELETTVSVLLSRLPGLRLAVDERDLSWSASRTIRKLTALPVTWYRGASREGEPAPATGIRSARARQGMCRSADPW